MINSGLTLGEFIDELKKQPSDAYIRFEFCGLIPCRLASYRGYYEDAALGYSDREGQERVCDLIEYLHTRVGKTMEGWKGGTYPIRLDTTLWVANPGDSTDTIITGLRRDRCHENPTVYIVTAREHD